MVQVPHLNELQEKYGERGLEVVGVSDEKQDVVAARAEKVGMKYTVALDVASGGHRAYAVTSIPRSFLIDRKGVLVWSGHPASLDEAQLEELLARK